MSNQIGERLAGVEAEFRSFRHEMLKDNDYIKKKLDTIVETLTSKVDRPYCLDRHDTLNSRLRTLEQKAPAIIQQIVLGLSMGIVIAVVSYLISRLP